MSRRGCLDKIICDNSKNFNVLETKTYASCLYTMWHFNSAQRGLLTRLMRSGKDLLNPQRGHVKTELSLLINSCHVFSDINY